MRLRLRLQRKQEKNHEKKLWIRRFGIHENMSLAIETHSDTNVTEMNDFMSCRIKVSRYVV